MTTGIYSLYWEERDLIYIGQSQNIELRFKAHIWDMHKGFHRNYKVQNAYNLYGRPILTIIEKCCYSECNDLEIFWTKEFDSLNSRKGLNIVEAGKVGWGTNSNNSKYSKAQILKVFVLLYKTNLTHLLISNRTGVQEGTIKGIKGGYKHLWLKEEYPAQYALMINRKINKPNYATKHGTCPIIVSPTGVLFEINTILGFCKTQPDLSVNVHSAQTNINNVINGKKPSYKGWKLLNFD